MKPFISIWCGNVYLLIHDSHWQRAVYMWQNAERGMRRVSEESVHCHSVHVGATWQIRLNTRKCIQYWTCRWAANAALWEGLGGVAPRREGKEEWEGRIKERRTGEVLWQIPATGIDESLYKPIFSALTVAQCTIKSVSFLLMFTLSHQTNYSEILVWEWCNNNSTTSRSVIIHNRYAVHIGVGCILFCSAIPCYV